MPMLHVACGLSARRRLSAAQAKLLLDQVLLPHGAHPAGPVCAYVLLHVVDRWNLRPSTGIEGYMHRKRGAPPSFVPFVRVIAQDTFEGDSDLLRVSSSSGMFHLDRRLVRIVEDGVTTD